MLNKYSQFSHIKTLALALLLYYTTLVYPYR